MWLKNEDLSQIWLLLLQTGAWRAPDFEPLAFTGFTLQPEKRASSKTSLRGRMREFLGHGCFLFVDHLRLFLRCAISGHAWRKRAGLFVCKCLLYLQGIDENLKSVTNAESAWLQLKEARPEGTLTANHVMLCCLHQGWCFEQLSD